jgi:hypothetical protein
VDTVVRDSQGQYTVNFLADLGVDTYIVQVTGMRNASNDVSSGCVRGSTTYANSVTSGWVKVSFFGSSDTARDITMGNVIVWKVL